MIATVVSALACGCGALFFCVVGGFSVAGIPFNISMNGQQSVETLPPTYGYVLLCLSVLFVAVPIAVGFFTLRKKPQPPAVNNEPIPPAS
jgi:predicted membrane channel-forming protein YqfA (hemolysin III family)